MTNHNIADEALGRVPAVASPDSEGAVETAPRRGRARRLAERGLTTIEYAIGLVAAATVALTLLRIFDDNRFFEILWEWVVGIFDMLAG
ncbi:DUF4244 domain-containing protein [Tessaracoccus terricola]